MMMMMTADKREILLLPESSTGIISITSNHNVQCFIGALTQSQEASLKLYSTQRKYC